MQQRLSDSVPSESFQSDLSDGSVSLEDAIDGSGFGRFQIWLLCICSITWAADAMEILLLSFLIPEIQKEWNIAEGMDGLLGAIVFLGILMGNFTWGYASDRYGRRAGFIGVAGFCSVFGMLSGFAQSFDELLVYRFFTGFGLGGSPVAFALLTEFLPTNFRAKALVLSSLFWCFGAIFEAMLAWIIIPTQGWRLFLIVSALPMILVLCSVPFIPESPHYLLIKGRVPEATELINRVITTNSPNSPLVRLKSGKTVIFSNPWEQFKILISPSLLVTSLLLWLIWFTDSFVYYGVIFLTPRFFSTSSAFQSTFISTLAEFPGVIISYVLIDSLGRRKSLLVVFSSTALCLLFLLLSTSTAWETAFLFLARMFIGAAFNASYIYSTEIYPTVVRSSGLGFCSAVARVSGIITSFISEDTGTEIAVIVFMAVSCVAAGASISLPTETANRKLEGDVGVEMESLGETVPMTKKVSR